jgi:hypothetical protein
MSSLITVDLPIKPYLVKYLIRKSNNKAIPLRFPNKHYFNLLLISLVTNYNSLSCIPLEDRDNVIEYFKSSSVKPGTISVVLPYNEIKNVLYYNYFSVKAKQKFRSEVRMTFNLEFSQYLIRHLRLNIPRLQICENFKKKYNITEDELKTETIYRYSSRLLEEL